MEVSAEKGKMMIKCINNISADISMNGLKLEEVTSFMYLGASLCMDGTCSAEVCIRIASVMARLNRIWLWKQDLAVQHYQLHKQVQGVQTSLLSLPSSSTAVKCEPCLLTPGSRFLKTNARGNFSTSPACSMRPMTGYGARSTSWRAHRNLFWQLSNKLAWFRHITCHDSLSKTIPWGHLGWWATPWSAQEMLDGQHPTVDISVNAGTAHKGLLQKKNWKRIFAELSIMSPQRPNWSRD